MLVKMLRTVERGRAVLGAGQVHDMPAEQAEALVKAGDAAPWSPPPKREAPPAPAPASRRPAAG